METVNSLAASRRTLLKAAAAAGVGLILGEQAIPLTVHAASEDVATIIGVALVAEYLAVTFTTNALANAAAIGLRPDEVTTIQGIAAAEALHVRALGGDPTTTPPGTGGFGAIAPYAGPFSFPAGTFTSRQGFANTGVILETTCSAAYLAAAREFAADARADLAQFAYQAGTVENEHRALARSVGGYAPYSDVAFQPNLLPTVAAATTVLTNFGFLSPTTGNSYAYTAANQIQALSFAGLLTNPQP